MNLEIFSHQNRLFRIFHNKNYFTVAIANAFTWTGHAVEQDNFFKFAIDYLTTGNITSLRKAESFSGRFGPEKLSSGLQGWKSISDQLGSQDFLSCDGKRLYDIQKECLDIAKQLLDQSQISGIGPWLFCAPFKIIAAHRKDIWKSECLDEVWMPLGSEVVRGVRKLIQQGCKFTQGLYKSMLSEEEGGLVEGMATVMLVQDMSKKIAQISSTRVLHINSGLYLYGKGEL
jgi:hypothetical protein